MQSVNPLKAKAEYTTKEGTKELLTLQKHQEDFIKQFVFSQLRGAVVYHGVGSGKTLTAVVSSYFYLTLYPNNKVIVISPSALLYNFINDMIQYGLNIQDTRY
jgi:N12 class adenine-specific DNA methylase